MEEILHKLQQFNCDRDVMRLNRFFSSSSILEALGVERSETKHSNFLHWLFSLPEINTIGISSPIMHLLDVIVRRAEQQSIKLDDHDQLKKDIITRKLKVSIDEVKTEVETTGVRYNNQTGRIDIWIKLKCSGVNYNMIHICIENKIWTNEHDDQTIKYFTYITGDKTFSKDIVFDQKYQKPIDKGDKPIFVFLTPSSEYEMKNNWKKQCICNKYIRINYQDIVSEVLSPLLDDDTTPNSIITKIDQYVRSLGIPSGKSNTTKDPTKVSQSIMAVNEETKLLAQKIFDNYDDLIIKMIVTSSNDPLLKVFKEQHDAFFTKLLYILAQSEENEYNYYRYQFLLLRLSGKDKNFFVKDGDNYYIVSQTDLAIRFAQAYYKNIRKSCNKEDEEIITLNNDFKNIRKRGLFIKDKKIDKDIKKFVQLDSNANIYMPKDIWGNKKTGEGYMKKMVEMVKRTNIIDPNIKFTIELGG